LNGQNRIIQKLYTTQSYLYANLDNNLDLAPPATTIDGLKGIPIDIQHLDSLVIFDTKTKMASIKAKMDFLVLDSGNPIFDLRQDIKSAVLNGKPVDINKLKHHDFGGGENSEMIIIEEVVEPGINTLVLTYEMNQPRCPRSKPIGWNSSSLYFDFWFTDLEPARYLEMWFPSNLIYDQFSFSLEIEIINTQILHKVFTNATVKDISLNHWQLFFPERFTSLSHMLVILPNDKIDHLQSIMRISNSTSEIYLDIFKLKSTLADLEWIEEKIHHHLENNIQNIGEYIHGNRFVAYIWVAGGRGMEYEGGIEAELDEVTIRHEIFHSWFARGAKPATQNDGWIDEAWTVYNTSNSYSVKPFNLSDDKVILSSSNNFNRTTPDNSYTDGARLFATLSSVIGFDNLNTLMCSFYNDKKGKLYTTKELEKYLTLKSGTGISQYFKRFVYGQD
jgi:hypothetical protein